MVGQLEGRESLESGPMLKEELIKLGQTLHGIKNKKIDIDLGFKCG